MRVYQRLTPLTPEERQFAEDYVWVIDWYFNISDYDAFDYYDVAIFGYLKAVKSWCAREELHQYSFSTIAKQMMRSYIGNERRKADRRIKAISLDASMDEDGRSLYELEGITYDHYQNQYVC